MSRDKEGEWTVGAGDTQRDVMLRTVLGLWEVRWVSWHLNVGCRLKVEGGASYVVVMEK